MKRIDGARTKSQIGIIGGGLAGLTAGLHLAKAGWQVTIFEKEIYPKHKVCGEYISNEVLPYWHSLGVQPAKWGSVPIDQLEISTASSKIIASDLSLGGFGISRYTLDYQLWQLCQQSGVRLNNEEIVDVTTHKNATHTIITRSKRNYEFNLVIGSYGKRSVLDSQLHRNFMSPKNGWLGIKAHYRGQIPSNRVQLHNFRGGYCGISQVEDGLVNVCYMVKYDVFKQYKTIDAFEKKEMTRNIFLKNFLENSERVFPKPITIAQINFSRKQKIENGIIMSGDAAGLIHPLCGNGMAMAIGSAKIVAESIINYDDRTKASKKIIMENYETSWNRQFGKRLQAGRYLQSVLLQPNLQAIAYASAKVLPGLVPKIVALTHGTPLTKAQV